jgi:hypothetical protein
MNKHDAKVSIQALYGLATRLEGKYLSWRDSSAKDLEGLVKWHECKIRQTEILLEELDPEDTLVQHLRQDLVDLRKGIEEAREVRPQEVFKEARLIASDIEEVLDEAFQYFEDAGIEEGELEAWEKENICDDLRNPETLRPKPL